METDLNFWLQLAVMLVCIGVGGRFGGVGLGAAGGLGVSILVLGFGLQPASPPVSTLLIIVAVIACTSILQGAGGLDLLVRLAEKMLRKWPSAITIVGPFVCSLFVVLCGTAYVAFAVYPVVAEVAASAKVRPERPIAASVISAGIAVVASPMSAAMAALVASLAVLDVSLIQILAVTVPAFIIATLCTCLSVYWKGTELEKDPEFIRRVQSGQYQELVVTNDNKPFEATKGQKLSVGIFLVGVVTVIIFGTFKELLPSWEAAGKISTLPIPSLIQMVMLAFGLFIIVFCKVPSSKFASGDGQQAICCGNGCSRGAGNLHSAASNGHVRNGDSRPLFADKGDAARITADGQLPVGWSIVAHGPFFCGDIHCTVHNTYRRGR